MAVCREMIFFLVCFYLFSTRLTLEYKIPKIALETRYLTQEMDSEKSIFTKISFDCRLHDFMRTLIKICKVFDTAGRFPYFSLVAELGFIFL